MIYPGYKEFIPKNNKWNKYIKSKTFKSFWIPQKPPNSELLEYLKHYFKSTYQCSREK